MTGRDRERLSPCVCSTLRMVSRAVTQLYDDMLRPSGLRVTQFSILGAGICFSIVNESYLARDLGFLERLAGLLGDACGLEESVLS